MNNMPAAAHACCHTQLGLNTEEGGVRDANVFLCHLHRQPINDDRPARRPAIVRRAAPTPTALVSRRPIALAVAVGVAPPSLSAGGSRCLCATLVWRVARRAASRRRR